jgi:hypothetical protein
MAKIPDHLHALIARCVQQGEETSPVVPPWRVFDQMPTYAIAHCTDAMLRQLTVVRRRQTVVLCGRHNVKAPTVVPPVR